MITSKDIALLQGSTDKPPILIHLEEGKVTLLHARWFALELPTSMFSADLKISEETPYPTAKQWRIVRPPEGGSFGQPIRITSPEGKPRIKLIADAGVALIHPSIYEVVTKHLPDPEFRVFPVEYAFVSILSAGVAVGGVAQVK